MTHHIVQVITLDGWVAGRVHADGDRPTALEIARDMGCTRFTAAIASDVLGQCGTDVRRPCAECARCAS